MLVGANKKKTKNKINKTEEEEPINIEETSDSLIQQFIENRDYSGAATVIDFFVEELQQPYTRDLSLWKAYSLFHMGKYFDAITEYQKLLIDDPNDLILNLYIASCHFYNGDYDEAQNSVLKGMDCDLKTRLMFHIAQHRNDEQQLFKTHSEMTGTLENQLSLAAIHFTRANYQDALDIYQKILATHPEFLAIYAYIAMCQFKLDLFQESNDSIDEYLAVNSDSAISLNLKACSYFRIFGAEIAESQLLQIKKFSSATYDFVDSIIQHNVLIFHDGENGLTILPKLIDVIPEARYNLSILYLRQNEPVEAYNVIKDIDPLDPADAILKAIISYAAGESTDNEVLIQEANTTFAEIGQMEVIKDTIPGRQCFAMSKFIEGDYESALRILHTIEEFIGTTDEFKYNIGLTLAALGRYNEAESYFVGIENEDYKQELFYTSWLSKCFIKNNKCDKAWELYIQATQTDDANTLLQIISNEAYLSGQYYYAMKAYHALTQFDLNPGYKQGMIASSAGLFRSILSQKEDSSYVIEILTILNSDPDDQQMMSALQIIQNYVDTSDTFNLIDGI